MTINKATLAKMKRQQQQRVYAKRMQDMASAQPEQLYDVVDPNGSIITRAPLHVCAGFGFGYSFNPVPRGWDHA